MDEQIARVIATISTLDSLSTFEANARQRDALTDEVKRAIKRRAGEVGRHLVHEKTGLDLTALTPAEEKIVEAVCEFLRIRKEQGKSATRTLDQLRNRGLIGRRKQQLRAQNQRKAFRHLRRPIWPTFLTNKSLSITPTNSRIARFGIRGVR